MKKNLLSFLIVVLIFSFGCKESISQGKSKVITTKEFAKKIKSDKNAVLLDLRTDGEVADGIIEGASQLDFYGDGFENMIEELDKDKTYYVYCKSGRRSAKAAKMMKKSGLNVYDLKGGITDWQAQGNPLKEKK